MTGVNYDKSRQKWVARTTVLGKRKSLGRFDTKEEAELALGLFKRDQTTQLNEAFDREFKKFAESSMRLEETQSVSIFTRLKGFRLKRHKL